MTRHPPAPPTGFSHPGCYAAALADCSPDISKEHVVPAAVLRRLTIDGRVNISNGAASRGETISRTPKALAAGILCSRHNNALSELDNVGVGFFQRLEQFFRSEMDADLPPAPSLFNGFDLERWLLKISAAHIASGWSREERVVPRWWLDVIWGDAPLKSPNGLYQLARESLDFKPGFQHSVLTDGSDPFPVGAYFQIYGIHLYVIADGAGRGLNLGLQGVHRPSGLIVETPRCVYATDFDFGPKRAEQGITLSFTGRRTEGTVPDAWALPRIIRQSG